MTIYIDSDFKCHVSDDGTRREFDAPFFDGKCQAFIEGYRYVPSGECWTREDNMEFQGEMISPWKDYNQLYKTQLEYELEQYKTALAEAEAAYENGVNSI